MPAVAVASTARNPLAAIRAAIGVRWLNALSRLWRGRAVPIAEAADVRFTVPPPALSSLGFREFTAPRRLQGGGALRLRTKAAGQIAAVAGLRTMRGRQR